MLVCDEGLPVMANISRAEKVAEGKNSISRVVRNDPLIAGDGSSSSVLVSSNSFFNFFEPFEMGFSFFKNAIQGATIMGSAEMVAVFVCLVGMASSALSLDVLMTALAEDTAKK